MTGSRTTRQARGFADRADERGWSTREKERRARMMRRIQTAATAQTQLAAAYDWFRSEASRSADGTAVMRDAAQYLTDQARNLAKGNAQ